MLIMDVGRIFSRGGTLIFPGEAKYNFPGGAKSAKFHFTHSKLRKRPFLLKI